MYIHASYAHVHAYWLGRFQAPFYDTRSRHHLAQKRWWLKYEDMHIHAYTHTRINRRARATEQLAGSHRNYAHVT